MTLGNMRELGVQRLVASCLNDAYRQSALIDVSRACIYKRGHRRPLLGRTGRAWTCEIGVNDPKQTTVGP